ncbi:MAG: NAD(P)H-dependent oxidoreductase [Pseudomonadota bacterium]
MTQTVLHIDASARDEGSVTRELSRKVVASFADATILRRDLAATPLPQVNKVWVEATFTAPDERSADQNAALELSDALVDELQSADKIVIGTPIYNFSIPAALKLWIDQVARVGRTFEYTAEGPRGLLSDKEAVVVVAAGGTPIGSDADYATPYLKHVLAFLGIHNVTVVKKDELEAYIARAA